MVRKFIATAIFLGGLTAPFFCHAEDGEPNNNPCQQLQVSRRKLDVTMDRIFTKYANNENFLNKLGEAQRAWVKYKNTHTAARFPNDTDETFDPAIPPECRCKLEKEMIDARVEQLKRWVDGTEERGSCAD